MCLSNRRAFIRVHCIRAHHCMRNWMGSQLSFFGAFQQPFDWPAPIMSPVKNLVINAQFLGPLLQSQGFAAKGNPSAIALIVALLLKSGPSAVFFAVMTVWIYAIHAHSFRAGPHVSQEVFEIQPAVTNGNSSAAVIGIRGRVRVVTSLQNPSPDHVSARPSHAMFCSGNRLDASTGFAIAVSKTSGLHGQFFATDTSAKPLLGIRNQANRGPSTKLLSWLDAPVRSAWKTASFVAVICTVHAPYNIRMAL